MRTRLLSVAMLAIAALALASLAPTHASSGLIANSTLSGKPLPIPEGPMGASNTLTGDPYWFQQGVQGDTGTYSSIGASVSIRTVYDNVNNDAHSYWVGSILANEAFVQVGYINGLTTSNQFYCCAWFFEYFPPGNTNSPPIIGPPGSAGPIGSWHTYSMNYTGNGVWSFYMDDQYLGSSPSAGRLYYLGAGDGDTGTHAVAALSEVAQTTVNTDVIGPAEFRNFQYEKSPNGWTPVPTGKVHWGYGATSQTNLPNPYSVAEIVGLPSGSYPNDFLTGSIMPYPGPSQPGVDECGSTVSNNADLWPIVCLPGSSTSSLSFVDENGTRLVPTWISLSDQGAHQIFYTDYQNYTSLTVPSATGRWKINQVSWHAVNVANDQVIDMSQSSQIFSTNVFSLTLAVVGYIYSLPVKNAPIIAYLPDSTNQTVRTNDNGEAKLAQLPPANYTLHITVPYGIASNQTHNIKGQGSLVAKVFSLPDLITIIVPPIFITILVAIIVVRKEHERQAMIQAQAPMQPVPIAFFCRSCGKPLSPTANFCTSCGTPVRMILQ